jgi:hypothetical protein
MLEPLSFSTVSLGFHVIRYHRQRHAFDFTDRKLSIILASELDIKEGKGLKTVENLAGGMVVAHFSDGASSSGSKLIGADGTTA